MRLILGLFLGRNNPATGGGGGSGTWIMDSGAWEDSGEWVDSDIWKDS